jgi:DNA mismatch repair ATPase MutL
MQKGSTSKNKGNDNFNYLGFRGEAIHSIGRVSASMTIESKSSVDGYRRAFNVNSLALDVFK